MTGPAPDPLPQAGRAGWPAMPAAFWVGLAVLAALALLGLCAPVISGDPNRLAPALRLAPPSAAHWFGTDAFGRDLFARISHGARTSLGIGLAVGGLTLVIASMLALLCVMSALADAAAMRVLDGLMAIPGVLLAVALISVTGPSFTSMAIAIAIPELPAMTRLIRGTLLSVRTRGWVEAARVAGCPPLRLALRHLLPSVLPLALVQTAFVCSSAILTESILSFLGVGNPPHVPSWGGVIGENRAQFQLAPSVILIPALFLTVTVLSINLMADALRDRLDPKGTAR